MLDYFYEVFGKQVTKEFIKDTVELFTEIHSYVRFDDLEKVIKEFISDEISKNNLKIQIQTSNKRLIDKKNNQYGLINYSIIQKRKNGDLFRYLKTLKKKELDTLRELVDIDNEYRLVDRENYNQSKMNRGGKSYGMMNGLNDVSNYV